MTKEQEEAIERLNKLKSRNILYGNRAGMIIEDFKTLQNDIETVLNMLKEKDTEIETLKRDFKIVDQECSRLERKEAKQDKIIDLILDKVNLNYAEIFYNNEVKEIIEIYEKTKNTNNLSGLELRKSCIKQYFEQEATKMSQERKKND